MNKVCTYLSQPQKTHYILPLIIYGSPGMGKSSLICKALGMYTSNTTLDNSTKGSEPLIIFRCVGESDYSSTPFKLMDSIAKEIQHETQIVTKEDYHDYESRIEHFRALLALVSQSRLIVLAIAKLDKLEYERDVDQDLKWLFGRAFGNVKMVVSLCDDSEANETIKQSIQNTMPQKFLEHKDPRTLSQTIFTWPDSLNIGTFISFVAKSALEKYTAEDDRKIDSTQEEAIISAYEKADWVRSSTENSLTPVALRAIYNYTKFIDPTGYSSLPLSYADTIDCTFGELEKRHGRQTIKTVEALSGVCRDGLSILEIEQVIKVALKRVRGYFENYDLHVGSSKCACIT